MITILIYITVAILAMLIVSYIADIEWMNIASWVLLILNAFIGWGALATSLTESKKVENAKVVEIVKGKHITVVSSIYKNDEVISTFKSNISDMITDTTTFKWVVRHNAYGSEIGRELSPSVLVP